MSHDIVIRGGQVVDGTGSEPFVADVAIDGDTITEIGRVDGKGKEEINAMQSCMEYQTCPLCTHCWSKPIGRNRLVYDGYRCFLPVDDPGRDKVVTYNDNVYEYR